jgi:two-component sensor histidine kinase
MANTGITLLYIDDDDGLRRLVGRGLTRHGYVVELASDGQSGLDRIAQGGIDVVALDQNMPGMDGLTTLGRLRELANPPPVVFVTASQESKVAIAALKAGAADYVIKDALGEFIPLLVAATEFALEAGALRRARDAAEAELRASRDRFEALAAERAMLLREVNHRVANSLQLIAAFLHMQGNTASPEVKEALNSATTRVIAVSQVHRRLYTSDDVKSVELDKYLSAMVEELQRSSESEDEEALTLSADPLECEPDRAVAIGVIVNELVINALKHAYPAGKGPVRIGLKAINSHRALLSVEDDGVGSHGHAATSGGLGQRIVKAMAIKLGADVTHDAAHSGTRVLVTFDLAQAR